uniref:Uncharacterized protein n=1 Tax=Dictyomenia sonderi TaxID=2007178 RepID=A0A1Z1MT84_9FLOR|nr:hypothetical protein [Dictyomenia sonderi]ARW69099.1 hypothetical protein [Dictyomenia sonderi]
MSENLHLLLNNIKGDWFLQENFYFLHNKKQKKYKERVSFLKNSQNTKFNTVDSIIKNINQQQSGFKIEKVSKHFIAITHTDKNQQVNYKEYIYLINNNFIISLIMIKKLQKKHYVGLKISSYIRLLQE